MRIQSALCLIVAAMASSAFASTYTAECTNNLTIQNAGPRQGANGLRGFNVQGLDNVSFASYGIAEWDASAFGIPGTITDISSVTLVLEKWHAAFSTSSGSLSIWMTSSYGLSMDQALAGSSPFKFSFDSGDVPSGMDRTVLQFVGPDDATSPYMNASMQPVGRIATVTFTAGNAPPEPDGFVYNIPLNLIPVVETEIINRLNAGQSLRLIVAPDDISVDGVFAGNTNTSTNPITNLVRQGPTLVIDADVAAANAVTGTVDFGQLTAAYNTGLNLPTSIPVSFRDASNTEIATGSATYDPVTGAFSAAVPGTVTVPFRVSFKQGFWLRKTMPNPADPAAPLGNYNFGTVTPLVGDSDDDNDITNGDYALWAAANGNSVTPNTDNDFDGDGDITNGDYALWAANNGNSGDI